MPRQNLQLGKLLPAPSLKEMVLATIREAMLAKKQERDMMYNETALTVKLGISRSPMREVLTHRASRGLITYFPHRYHLNCQAEAIIHIVNFRRRNYAYSAALAL